METLFENILIYLVVFLFCLAVVVIYLRRQKRQSKQVEEKIVKAKLEGLYEPVSLHPVVDPNNCIGTGACIKQYLNLTDYCVVGVGAAVVKDCLESGVYIGIPARRIK